MTSLPPQTIRLFPHEAPESLCREGRSLLFARLLEDGDREDLRWLAGVAREAELALWLRRRGARKLSRRSRFFWERVLGVEASPAPPAATQLWPL